MTDIYMKAVLSVIAVSLTALVFQNATTPALAIGEGCGSFSNPCYVKTNYREWLNVRITNKPLEVNIANEPIQVTD